MGDKEASKREQIKADAQVKIAESNAAIERLRLKNEEEQKIREMKEKQYNREHAVRMEKLREEALQKQREQKAEMERKRQAHIQKLKQMAIDQKKKDKNKKIKQKNDSIAACNAEIAKLDELINTDSKQLEIEKKDFEKTSKA